jgi:hypothetical protein
MTEPREIIQAVTRAAAEKAEVISEEAKDRLQLN